MWHSFQEAADAQLPVCTNANLHIQTHTHALFCQTLIQTPFLSHIHETSRSGWSLIMPATLLGKSARALQPPLPCMAGVERRRCDKRLEGQTYRKAPQDAHMHVHMQNKLCPAIHKRAAFKGPSCRHKRTHILAHLSMLGCSLSCSSIHSC